MTHWRTSRGVMVPGSAALRFLGMSSKKFCRLLKFQTPFGFEMPVIWDRMFSIEPPNLIECFPRV